MPRGTQPPDNQLGLFGPAFTEVKGEFCEKLEKGELLPCPCCGRNAKIYTRLLNSGMARDLIRLYQMRTNGQPQHGWVEWRQLWSKARGAGREFQRLRHWNLIEQHPEDSAFWRITQKGESFTLGFIRVPRYLTEFATQPRAFSDETTHIREAITEPFDYDELMAETPL